MSAEMILRLATRRMWALWVPLIAVFLVAFSVTAPMDNGLSGLLALISGCLVLAGCTDWLGADMAATRASSTAGH